MKRIAIFQSDLGVGGIQKSIVNLLRNFDYAQFEVDLFLSERSEFWQVDFPEQLHVRYLKPTSSVYKFMPFDLARRLLRYDFSDCGEYDLAIDFNSYQCSCAVGATTVPARSRVMWVHNNVEIKLGDEWKYRVLWHFFKGKFKYYDAFVYVSRALVEPFQKMSGVRDKPFYVIPNYIDVAEIREKMLEEPADLTLDESAVNFCALGRLCHQKGYDIMLETFAAACAQREDLRLYVIGDGPDREALTAQRDALGLQDKVTFLGNRENPYAYMSRMDAFLSTSRYEGQPLNIMEAMAVGLPLYCSKNLEKYTEGLVGCEDLTQALLTVRKAEKRPDPLEAYNTGILRAIAGLAAGEE
ncbi:MAG: glycosyltransferase [Oscillospiraceae bacterium]|nr:glycosyltransferase [Oscillospiraceae bacterium]